ncbi:hypothetical protein LG329_15745 [Virgibacillus necropolis]|uniref:CBO0543 family protein n=1 Tax=Virgibacillus necropolis TaxID=163877 RepID=UPI00384D7E0A
MSLAIINEIIEANEKYGQLKRVNFFENVIFSYQWWILLFITFVVWIIWGLLVDKSRMKNIFLVGMTTSLLAVILDGIGLTLNLWAYPYQLLYFTGQLFTVDLAIIPVFYMLLYQYSRTWKSYFVKLILLSIFATFVAEPIFVKLDIYRLLQWEHWYSTPFYILIGVFVKWLVDKIDERSA